MLRFFDAVAGYRQNRERSPGGSDAASAPSGGKPGGDSWLGIAIASHPADAERVRFFRDAAAR